MTASQRAYHREKLLGASHRNQTEMEQQHQEWHYFLGAKRCSTLKTVSLITREPTLKPTPCLPVTTFWSIVTPIKTTLDTVALDRTGLRNVKEWIFVKIRRWIWTFFHRIITCLDHKKILREWRFASDDEVTNAVHKWVRSQQITFFADEIRRFVNRYEVRFKKGWLCWGMIQFAFVIECRSRSN